MVACPSAMRLTLWIDADDTLWDNSIYFEEAIAEFIDYLQHPTLSAEAIRKHLDAVEIENIKIRGYGSDNFTSNLEQCFAELRGRPCAPREKQRIQAMTERLRNHPVEPFEGVEETLRYLRRRHSLRLVTKGNPIEQAGKIERSGLGVLFDDCSIVREKTAAAYRAVLRRSRAEPSRTWMVGNSPKSDINPALAAGIGAVWIPHAQTWLLECEAVPEPHERFHVREQFRDLQQLF